MSYHYWGISICYCGTNFKYLDILHLVILLAVFCRFSCHSFNPPPYIVYQDTSLFAVLRQKATSMHLTGSAFPPLFLTKAAGS